MIVHGRRWSWMFIVGCLGFSTDLTWAQGEAPAATRPAGEWASGRVQTGVVTGSDVYVRSGWDQNYYPVTKLSQGDEITVVGRRYSWLEILPPEGTFSVIDKAYVDRQGDDAGVLNERSWVQAGSSLNPSKYAKQVQLDRGARVTILGETTDQTCYKIAPPLGATLYIHSDFVRLLGEGETGPVEGVSDVEPVLPGDLGGGVPDITWTTRPVVETLSTRPAGPRQRQVEALRDAITAIEAEIAAEGAKPVMEREYEPIIERLRPMAEQDDDQYAKVYAESRIKVLHSHVDLRAKIQRIEALKRGAFEEAQRWQDYREQIRITQAAPPDRIVVKGKIIHSNVYTGGPTSTKRWRVVEHGRGTDRTLAYIELPEGSTIDPTMYYDKYVGIRARSHHVPSGGGIPPVIVYTVDEIVELDPGTGELPGAGATTRPSYPTLP